MSSLVAMIVLAYLLVIALCVALWTALSLRRDPAAEPATERRAAARLPQEPEPDGREATAPSRSDTHDAYRGARAKTRPAAAPDPSPDRVRPATAVPLFATDREPLPAAPLHAPIPLDVRGTETRPDAVRVTESKRSRERSAQRRSDELRSNGEEPEDAFERFLRANEDFER